MRAEAAARVEPGGTLRHVESQPPLTLRRVHGPRDAVALCLVGTAAGPLPGDDLHLRLDVADGARATLQAAGASIAQGRDGAPATLTIEATVGEHATLLADPGALVVCAGAHVDVQVRLDLAATAEVDWYELVVLGRTGEPPGTATVSWQVTRGGRPLLLQRTDLTEPWALRGHRVLASRLRTGGPAGTVVHSATAVTQRLAADATLTTTLAADAASVTKHDVLDRRAG